MIRIASWVTAAMLIASTSFANDVEVRQLREALAVLATEQQAVFQQFQMVQSLRAEAAYTARSGETMVPVQPGSLPNYDDVVRERDTAAQRQTAYQSELDRLYQRYRELEEQKRPLLQRLSEISASTPPASPR